MNDLTNLATLYFHGSALLYFLGEALYKQCVHILKDLRWNLSERSHGWLTRQACRGFQESGIHEQNLYISVQYVFVQL
jgi:hypothetical protein